MAFIMFILLYFILESCCDRLSTLYSANFSVFNVVNFIFTSLVQP